MNLSDLVLAVPMAYLLMSSNCSSTVRFCIIVILQGRKVTGHYHVFIFRHRRLPGGEFLELVAPFCWVEFACSTLVQFSINTAAENTPSFRTSYII